MIGRADIEGSKSYVAMNAWQPQASYPCGICTPAIENEFFIDLMLVLSRRILSEKLDHSTGRSLKQRSRGTLRILYASGKNLNIWPTCMDIRQGHTDRNDTSFCQGLSYISRGRNRTSTRRGDRGPERWPARTGLGINKKLNRRTAHQFLQT